MAMTTSLSDFLATGRAARAHVLARIRRRLRRWEELQRQRSQLARLDERTLRDIGVSYYEARQEARRWFWDEPDA
jgi:uncharacterized protein YjiS (DUF1127 family)